MRGVEQATKREMSSEYNYGSEHLPAGWRRSGPGSGQADTALQPVLSNDVRRWSEIFQVPFAGLTRLATQPGSLVPDRPPRAVHSRRRFSRSAGCNASVDTPKPAINRHFKTGH